MLSILDPTARPKRRTLLWQCIADLLLVSLCMLPAGFAIGLVNGLKGAAAGNHSAAPLGALPPSANAVLMILTGLAAGVVAVFRMNRESRSGLALIGLKSRPPAGWWRWAGLAFGSVLAFNLAYAGLLRLMHVSLQTWNPFQDMLAQGGGWPLWVLIGYVVVGAPLAEELLYRGCMMGRFQAHGYALAGAVTSALLFSASHGALQLLPVYFMMGLAFAWLYRRAGSLWPSIALHSFNNACAVGAVLLLHKS